MTKADNCGHEGRVFSVQDSTHWISLVWQPCSTEAQHAVFGVYTTLEIRGIREMAFVRAARDGAR